MIRVILEVKPQLRVTYFIQFIIDKYPTGMSVQKQGHDTEAFNCDRAGGLKFDRHSWVIARRAGAQCAMVPINVHAKGGRGVNHIRHTRQTAKRMEVFNEIFLRNASLIILVNNIVEGKGLRGCPVQAFLDNDLPNLLPADHSSSTAQFELGPNGRKRLVRSGLEERSNACAKVVLNGLVDGGEE